MRNLVKSHRLQKKFCFKSRELAKGEQHHNNGNVCCFSQVNKIKLNVWQSHNKTCVFYFSFANAETAATAHSKIKSSMIVQSYIVSSLH